MSLIGSGTTIKLKTLLKSGEVDDKTNICIYDKKGKFVVRGLWYKDKILDHSEAFGKAFELRTKHSVMWSSVKKKHKIK